MYVHAQHAQQHIYMEHLLTRCDRETVDLFLPNIKEKHCEDMREIEKKKKQKVSSL